MSFRAAAQTTLQFLQIQEGVGSDVVAMIGTRMPPPASERLLRASSTHLLHPILTAMEGLARLLRQVLTLAARTGTLAVDSGRRLWRSTLAARDCGCQGMCAVSLAACLAPLNATLLTQAPRQ